MIPREDMSMASGLRFGPLGTRAVHLCIDMQTLFAERTDWHVPWLERVLPAVTRLATARRERTLFSRFVPPERPEDAPGAWRRYYAHWRHMTGERLDPRLIQLVPPLAALVPPATVIDKAHYSPFKEQAFLASALLGVGINVLTLFLYLTFLTFWCFSVRLTGAVSPSRPDVSKAPRTAAVNDGRRPPRLRRAASLTAASTAPA
jgi:hypothetical protein